MKRIEALENQSDSKHLEKLESMSQIVKSELLKEINEVKSDFFKQLESIEKSNDISSDLLVKIAAIETKLNQASEN